MSYDIRGFLRLHLSVSQCQIHGKVELLSVHSADFQCLWLSRSKTSGLLAPKQCTAQR